MKRFCGHLRFCLSLSVVVGLMASQASAGSLTLVVTAADGVSTTITGGPLGTLTNGGNTLTVTSIAALNTFLNTNGSAVQFNSLAASSDFAPGGGVATGSFVTQSGSVYFDTALAGTGVVTVQAFQTGFVLPTGPAGVMQSSATANYTQAPTGSTETFTSSYNSTVNALPLTSTSTDVSQNNYSPSNNTAIPTFVTPFEVSNTTAVVLLPNLTNQATDGFSGSTTVTTTSVPEPASLALVFTGIPFVVVGWLRRRRAVA